MLAALGGSAAVAAEPDTVGACAWRKVAMAEKTGFFVAYHQEIGGGMSALGEHSDVYRAFVAGCLGRAGAPGLWADSAIGAEAIQDAAAGELKTDRRIEREALEAAWLSAPEAARHCTRANAAKVFGITQTACSDPKAPLDFLKPLNLTVTPENGDDVRQALYYFTAKAQAEWAQQLLNRFKSDGLPPKPATTPTAAKPQ